MGSYLTPREKWQLPPMRSHDAQRTPASTDPVRMGRVEINNDLCNGCRLCVLACPPKSLTMTGKRSVAMIGDAAPCIGCGDCLPICHPGAINLVQFMAYDGLYKFIGRAGPSLPRRF